MWRINLGLKISGKTYIIHPNSLVRVTVLPIKMMHFGGISFSGTPISLLLVHTGVAEQLEGFE